MASGPLLPGGRVGTGAEGDSMLSGSSSESRAKQLTPDSDSDSEDVLYTRLGEDGRGIEPQDHAAEKMPRPGSSDDEDEIEGRGRQGSVSTTHSFQLYTPDEERNVMKKFDRRLVLFVALLYMLSFLDRSSNMAFSSPVTLILTKPQISATQQ